MPEIGSKCLHLLKGTLCVRYQNWACVKLPAISGHISEVMSLALLQMCLFTFFSAVCVVLQMVGTLLTGDAGGLLKSLLMCEKLISADVCKCCDSIQACQHSPGGIEFEGVDDCTLLTGLLTGLMYGLFVLTIFGSVLCFVATILGCTAVARGTGRNQVLLT